MGGCWSCCGSRKHKKRSSDRDPLLPKDSEHNDASFFTRTAAMVAAVKAGKLPTQAQIDRMLQAAARSDILAKTLHQETISPEGQRLLDSLESVLGMLLVFGLEKNHDDTIQDLIYDLRSIHVEKITVHPEKLIDPMSEVRRDIQKAARVTEAEVQQDLFTAMTSLRDIVSLLTTFGAFRLLVFNVIMIARQALSDVASHVDAVAQKVEGAAQGVEQLAEAVASAAGDIGDTVGVSNVQEASETNIGEIRSQVTEAVNLAKDQVEAIRLNGGSQSTGHGSKQGVDAHDVVIAEVQEALYEVRSDGKTLEAMAQIVSIVQKYMDLLFFEAETLQDSANATVGTAVKAALPVDTSPARMHATNALQSGKTILERLASETSLDPILSSANDLLFGTVSSSPEQRPKPTSYASAARRVEGAGQHTDTSLRDTQQLWQSFSSRITTYLRWAQHDADYILSSDGKKELEALFTDGRSLYSQGLPPTTSSATLNLLKDVNNFVAKIQRDRTTHQLISTLQNLASCSSLYFSSTVTSQRGKSWSIGVISEVIWGDFQTFVLPRLLRAAVKLLWSAKEGGLLVPLPRVEMTSPSADVAIDARVMRLSSYASEPPRSIWESILPCFFPSPPEPLLEEEHSALGTLAPSTVNIRRVNDVHINLQDNTGSATRMKTVNNVHININDLISSSVPSLRTIELRGISYFVHAKSFVGYRDEGVLDLEIDLLLGQDGVSVDVDLELEAENTDTGLGSELRVSSVSLRLPPHVRITPRILNSRHWIINRFYLEQIAVPLAHPLVKREVRILLEGLIKQGLEGVGSFWTNVVHSATQRSRLRAPQEVASDSLQIPRSSDWVGAVIENIMTGLGSNSEEPPEPPTSDTHVNVHLGAIQVTSSPKDDKTPDTQIAVGIVPTLLPSEAIPSASEAITEQVTAVIEGTEAAKQRTVETVEAVESEAERARDTYHAVEQTEDGTYNWRSDVFNIV